MMVAWRNSASSSACRATAADTSLKPSPFGNSSGPRGTNSWPCSSATRREENSPPFSSTKSTPRSSPSYRSIWLSISETAACPQRLQLLTTLPFARLAFKAKRRVRRHLDRRRPDVVVNFYEPIVGLAFHFFRPRTRMVAAANQYLFDHPTFEPPLDQKADWKGLRAFNRVTAPPPATKLAFSFHPLLR